MNDYKWFLENMEFMTKQRTR